mgnify:CR=1 FL=1
MAYNSFNSNNYNKGNNRSNFNNNPKGRDKSDKIDTINMNLQPMTLPDDYIQKAETIMKEISRSITTSKIRGFLSLVSKVYNVESVRTEDTLLPESMDTIQMMRIRIVYEAGRDTTDGVKRFLEKSNILNYIKSIGNSRQNFISFARYMEALVAYHRFYGGKE